MGEGKAKQIRRPQGRPLKHGARMLERLFKENALDERTATAKMRQQIRLDLIEDAGGEEALTHRERYLLDRAAGLLLIAASLEAYLLKQPTLVTRSGKVENVLGKVYLPALKVVTNILNTLGLKPPKPTKDDDLDVYLKQKRNQPQEATE